MKEEFEGKLPCPLNVAQGWTAPFPRKLGVGEEMMMWSGEVEWGASGKDEQLIVPPQGD